MNRKILFVDDEVQVLNSLKRVLRGRFEVVTASSAQEGENALRSEGPFALVVSDYRMPLVDGVKFLTSVRQIAPDTIRMMLTGQADLAAAMEAINQGNIFRFLWKPCPPEILEPNIEAGLEQYRLVTAERELLETTFRGALRLVIDLFSANQPEVFRQVSRVCRIARTIAGRLNLKNSSEIEIAGMLSPIGGMTLPNDILRKRIQGKQLSDLEQKLYARIPEIGAQMLRRIPRLELIAEAVALHAKGFDGSGPPLEDGRKGKDIPVIARILRVVFDFDSFLQIDNDEERAFNRLSQKSHLYDPDILSALSDEIAKSPVDRKQEVVTVLQLKAGMVLMRNLYNTQGTMMLPAGQELSEPLCLRLHNWVNNIGTPEALKISVLVSLPKEFDS